MDTSTITLRIIYLKCLYGSGQLVWLDNRPRFQVSLANVLSIHINLLHTIAMRTAHGRTGLHHFPVIYLFLILKQGPKKLLYRS